MQPPTDAVHNVQRVAVIATDRALFALLREWLAECGCTAVEKSATGDAEPCELVIVDIPFPRDGGVELVKRITSEYSGVPILALSSCFFAATPCGGGVAKALGVARVLPKPVPREKLIDTVRTLLNIE
ncbi:MAG: hypothetical protein ACRECQ_12380 [Burkholderiaceae bacterium]